jgi:hypothetical protein
MTDQQRPHVSSVRWLAPLVLLLTVALTGLAAPSYAASSHAPAQASGSVAAAVKGYVYWGYYLWNDKKGSWDYATVGANDETAIPEDGDVLGFRWALVVEDPRLPRADGDFDAICADTEPSAGQKRLAFVIDYGTESDAVGSDETPQPEGVCAQVDENFTAQQALQAEVPLRTGDGGLICGINDYPSTGCGSTVPDAEEPPSDTPVELALPGDEPPTSDTGSSTSADQDDDDDSSNTWLTVGIPVAVVVLLGVGALVMRRRQS